MKCKSIISNILQSLCLALAVTLAGCSDDTSTSLWGIGRIKPEVTVNPEVISASGDTAHGIIPNLPASDDFSLTVSDTQGGFSHTWESWTDYDPTTGLKASRYLVEAFLGDSTHEGFDAPWFYASKTVDVADGEEVPVALDCRLANAMWRIRFSEGVLSRFTEVSAFLHTPGHPFVRYAAGESRALFMMPDKTCIIMSLTMADGKQLDFLAAQVKDVKESHLYDLTVDASEASDGVTELSLSFDENIADDDVVIRLTDEFINSTEPELHADGFVSGDTLTVDRGTDWQGPLAVAASRGDVAQLQFSFTSSSSCFEGLPREIDLLDLDASTKTKLTQSGIVVKTTADSVRVDFSGMMSRLSADAAGEASFFSLSAINRFSKISRPCVFYVKTKAVELNLLSLSPAIMGIDVCEIEFASPVDPQGKIRIEAFNGLGLWETLEITQFEKTGDGFYRARFKVPAGQSPVPVRVFYLGEPKFSATVERVSPKFTINVDPFALKAYIQIVPEDPELLALITSSVNIFSGSAQVSVIERDEQQGLVTVAGLTENSRYDFRASLFSRPTDDKYYTPAVSVRTEKCANLSNGSFEDAKTTIKYKDLLSGGRYSQSVVPIFNQQNKVSYDLMTPKNWANTNDKTFSKAAKNQNTWYMQPSAYIVLDSYNGGYALKLTSTAWDLNGEPIADYLQESQPFVYYSRVIPEISHRAAGRIFLGEYSFDPSTGRETYNEGIDFTSRPSAVSGFYKYLPCTVQPSDKGLVKVEVLGDANGRETVIGNGELLLTSSASYRAFSVPVVYNRLNVKATKLRLMFSSTENIGTIDYETAHIVTFSNPETSSSLGSELWIDEVSLSY